MLKQRFLKHPFGFLALLIAITLILSSSTAPVYSTDPPQRVESDDSLVQAEGTWTPINAEAASGGSYLLSGSSASDVLELSFEGTSIEIIYVQGPGFGTLVAEIDNTRHYITTTNTETVFNARTLVDDLGDSSHVLRVFPLDGVIAVDAFFATLPPTSTPGSDWVVYPDTEPRLEYGGGDWTTFNVGAAEGGTLTATDSPLGRLEVDFEGTGIRVIYSTGPEGSGFIAHVDDRMTQTGLAHSETYTYGNVLAFKNLDPGQHRLHLSNGAGAMWIEAVHIQGHILTYGSWTTVTQSQAAVSPPTVAVAIAPGDTAGLIAAIEAANANCQPTTIDLAAGSTYMVSQRYPGSENAFPEIVCTITIEGHGATIVQDPAGDRIRFFSNIGTLTLNQLTLQGGDLPGFSVSGVSLFNYGTLNLIDSVITEANADAAAVIGGMIYNHGTMHIEGSLFTNNSTASLGTSGGIIWSDRPLTITNSRFENNANNVGFSWAGANGGILLAGNDQTTIIGSYFLDGDAKLGGAIYTGSNVTITDSVFDNNFAVDDGGAVYAQVSAVITANNSCFTNNNTEDDNGKDVVYSDAAVDFTDNWWGSPAGPSSQDVSPLVEYVPFLHQPTGACLVDNSLTVTTYWGDTYEGVDFDGMNLEITLDGAPTTAPLYGNTTGPLPLLVQPTSTVTVKALDIPGITPEILETWGDIIKVGLYQTNTAGAASTMTTLSIVEPPEDTYWYTLSGADTDPGYSVVPELAATGNNVYFVDLDVYLCRDGEPPLASSGGVGAVALLLVFTSGALGTLGATAWRAEQKRLQMVSLVLAGMFFVGAVGVLIVDDVMLVDAADFDPYTLPDCAVLQGTITVTPSMTAPATAFPTNTLFPTDTPSLTAIPTNTPLPTNTIPPPTETPTSSPTPDYCTAKIVSTPDFNNTVWRSQEAADMLAIVNVDGVIIHAAPTINAMRSQSNYLAWGSQTSQEILYQIRFEDTTTGAYQQWYGFDDTSPSGIGWFVAEMTDGQAVFIYATLSACGSLSTPSTLSFPYDREMAVHYAIEQVYQNDVIASPGDHRVSARLITGTPIPFSNFDYNETFLIHDSTGKTGSAIFVSEAIWMGGIPMTVDIDDPDTANDETGNANCLDYPGSSNENFAGWRFCAENSQMPSQTWSFHTGLMMYYTDVPYFSQEPGQLPDPTKPGLRNAVLQDQYLRQKMRD